MVRQFGRSFSGVGVMSFSISACVFAIGVSVLGFAPGFVSEAQASDEKASTFVLCKNSKNVRSLRVVPSKEGCTATYTKGGVDEVVGSDRSSSNCKSILSKIQTTLTSSKWNCREVSAATLTTSKVVR